ncbi:hypothetical protein D3C73_975620 [compost metagenome]
MPYFLHIPGCLLPHSDFSRPRYFEIQPSVPCSYHPEAGRYGQPQAPAKLQSRSSNLYPSCLRPLGEESVQGRRTESGRFDAKCFEDESCYPADGSRQPSVPSSCRPAQLLDRSPSDCNHRSAAVPVLARPKPARSSTLPFSSLHCAQR